MSSSDKMDELYDRVREAIGERLTDAELWEWLALCGGDLTAALNDIRRGYYRRPVGVR